MRKQLLRAFIVLNLCSILLAGFPRGDASRVLIAPLKPYINAVGLWQGWDLFAPNPADTDVWLSARGVRTDQSSFTWRLPEQSGLGIISEIAFERARKFEERIRQDKYRYMWKDSAMRLATRIGRENGPVQEISLVRSWVQVLSPYGVRPVGSVQEFTFHREPGGDAKP